MPPPPRTAPPPDFEDLTLAQAVGQFWRAPLRTLRNLARVARLTDDTAPLVWKSPQNFDMPAATVLESPVALPVDKAREASQLVLRVLAFIIAWWGATVLATSPIRSEEVGLAAGAPFLLVGFGLWLVAEAVPLVWRGPRVEPLPEAPARLPHVRASSRLVIERMGFVSLGIITSALAWVFNGANNFTQDWAANTGNQFTVAGVITWAVSIVAWVLALVPIGWSVRRALRGALGNLRPRLSWPLVILLLIMAVGGYFRLRDLPATPPEMTSDHVEKLLDSWRVSQGEADVFFANNGGREPAQMYLMALITTLPGVEMNFTGLKLLSALEGLLLLPLLWWLGREIVGRDDRRLGNWLGLALAGLVAVSYWHVALSRLGLRIVLTTLVAAALLMFLSRALRWNRREDFLKAGLVVGVGLYMYQAVRMLPVVIVVGVGLAFLFRARTMLARRDTLLNLAALVLVSLALFVPMLRYMYDYPEDFWRRTTGRLLGDDIIETTDADGSMVRRNPSLQERIDAFGENIPVLVSNFRNALLMFHWKGDVAWINGSPNAPTLDPVSGGLLMVGLAAWLALLIRQRDVVLLLVPLMILIMLLPSALSLAYPVENPSATRSSGAIPAVYLIAALPLALIGRSLWRIGGRAGVSVAVLATALLLGGSYAANAKVYFEDYRRSYLISSLPYTEVGGLLRDFAASSGYGNAFMIAYPYWWDHRAVGIEGGVLDWPNGIISLDRVPDFLRLSAQRVNAYTLDPNGDLLFFFSPEDEVAPEQLVEWFPQGHLEERQSYQPEDVYMIYTVPALDEAGFQAWLEEFGE